MIDRNVRQPNNLTCEKQGCDIFITALLFRPLAVNCPQLVRLNPNPNPNPYPNPYSYPYPNTLTFNVESVENVKNTVERRLTAKWNLHFSIFK